MSKKYKKKANIAVSFFKWLRRRDLNPRSLAYEASENDQTSLLRYKIGRSGRIRTCDILLPKQAV